MSARARCASGPQQSGFDDAMPSVNSTNQLASPSGTESAGSVPVLGLPPGLADTP